MTTTSDYGMTETEMVAYALLGSQRHPDAPTDHCGDVCPKGTMEQEWCRRRPAHDGDHCWLPGFAAELDAA